MSFPKKCTLCLNMIVKDEAHIITKTLTDLCEKVEFDYWVICDTGSTDKTLELIQTFFDNKKIKGELIRNEWVNFGHNRSLALASAFQKTDYLLVFDADDHIDGKLVVPANIFEYDTYYLTFGEKIKYKRPVLLNNKMKYEYVGVLHEYLECKETKHTSFYLNGNYFIHSGKSGNRSTDPDKYLKDALLLETAYEASLKKSDDIYMRYSFYCANSYRDANQPEKAIKWYKNTLSLNNWSQEKYVSCLYLYELYTEQNNERGGLLHLIEACKYDETRIECVFRLIKYFCIQNQNSVAHSFYTLIQENYENKYMNGSFDFDGKLFIKCEEYSFYLPYYMIIVSEKLKKHDIGLKMFSIIFDKKNVNVDGFYIKNLVFNLQFFIEKNTRRSFVTKWQQYLTLINEKKHDIDTDLVNKYEIYNIANFTDLKTPSLSAEKDTGKYLVVAILAKDKEAVLPFYLECMYNQTYDKKFIHLYIRTNDNRDNTASILMDFIQKYGNEYASIYFDDSSISDKLRDYSQHEWNTFRFKILGKIRQASVDYAVGLNAHYFVADCDNFLIPTTISSLFQNKHIGVVSPMMRIDDGAHVENLYSNPNYSNFHHSVTSDGYYKGHDTYYKILHNKIVGLCRVCCVHCTYLISNKFLSSVSYVDFTERYEYVVFSETLRRKNIPQYIDNTQKWGFLTFADGEPQLEQIFLCNKKKYQFSYE